MVEVNAALSEVYASRPFRRTWCLAGARVSYELDGDSAVVDVDALEAKYEAREFLPEVVARLREELGEDAVSDVIVTFSSPTSEIVSTLRRARTLARIGLTRSRYGAEAASTVRLLPSVPEPTPDDEPPKRRAIEDTEDEASVTTDTLWALAKREDIFVMGKKLVQLDAHSRPCHLTKDSARDLASSVATYSQANKKGELEPCKPPGHIGGSIISRNSYPMARELRGIVRRPFLRADGSVVERAGWDISTCLFYAPNNEYPQVPQKASVYAARTAFQRLAELFADFPFAGPKGLGISFAIASSLTLHARHLLDCVPAFVFAGTNAGAGKGLAIDIAGIIGDGECPSRAPWSSSADEQRKLLDGLIRAGARVTHLDNVISPLGGADIERLSTGPSYDVRILGRTEVVTYPNQLTIFASGNGFVFSGDMPRRAGLVTIAPLNDRPDLRTDWRIPKLRQHVLRHRAALMIEALTILVAHARAGRPAAEREGTWGSFEQWTSIVADAVVFAGGVDPIGARVVREAKADNVTESLDTLVRLWRVFGGPEGTQVASSRFIESATADAEARVCLDEVLDAQVPAKSDKEAKATRLTALLTKHEGRWTSVNVGTEEMPAHRLLGFVKGGAGKYGRRWILTNPKGG